MKKNKKKLFSYFAISISAITLFSIIFLVSCNSLVSNASNSTEGLKYSGLPKQIISIDQAIAMKNEYKKNIAPLIERSKNDYGATECAWISLDTLKKYIALLEEVKRLNKQDISGVRIYFASYPNSRKFDKSGEEVKYPGRETIFLAPTMKVASTELSKKYNCLENVPFYISSSGSNPLIGSFEVIEGLLHKYDNRPRKVGMKGGIPPGAMGFRATVNEEQSLIVNSLGCVPPPRG